MRGEVRVQELSVTPEKFDVIFDNNSTNSASPSIMKEPGSAGSGNKVNTL